MRVKEGAKEQAILDAAVKVFAQRGYHQAKISSIADKAKVATGSVYLYFRNKEEILVILFERLWISVLGRIVADGSSKNGTPEQNLMALVDMVFDAFQRNPDLATVFVNEQHRLLIQRKGQTIRAYDEFLELAMQIIKDGVRSKNFRGDVDLNFLRNFILGGLRSILRLWAQDPHAYPLENIRTNMKQLIMHGLAGE
jgi:TetR/AcrR family transcriptional regulator, fatty acid metabolism regulator protein